MLITKFCQKHAFDSEEARRGMQSGQTGITVITEQSLLQELPRHTSVSCHSYGGTGRGNRHRIALCKRTNILLFVLTVLAPILHDAEPYQHWR